MSNNNDMKLIMEAWRQALNEVDPYGTVFLNIDPESMRTKDLSYKEEKLIAEMVGEGLFLTAQVLDPSGGLSYADLGRAWYKYTSEFNFKDPLSLDNLANAGMVVINTIDIIPVATLFVKPVTIPLESAKAAGKLAEKAATLAGTTSRPKVKEFALASQKKFQQLQNAFNRKARKTVVKLGPEQAMSTYGRWIKVILRSKRNKLYGQDKFISKYKDKFGIPLGAVIAGAISLAIGKTVYDIFFKDQKLPSKTTLEEMKEIIDSIKKSAQDGTFKREFLLNKANEYNNELIDLGESSENPVFSEWSRTEELIPSGVSYDEYKRKHIDEVVRGLENDPDIDWNKTIDKLAKEHISNIEKQYREKQMDLYKFEKDPETGAMVSPEGDKEAAIRAAEQTLNKKISKAIKILNTLGSEKEAEDKEEKSGANTYDDTPQSIPGRLQI